MTKDNSESSENQILKSRIAALEQLIDVYEKSVLERSDALLEEIDMRKEVEDALKENVHFLQTLIDAIPNPIFYKDISCIYQGCNKAFESFIGLNKNEIVGKSVYEIAPRELADRYHEMDMALFDQGGVQVYESSVKDADGNLHNVIFNKATCINASGGVSGMVGIILDITARKRAEEEKEKLIVELRGSLARIKNLNGLLPICAWCKKIRDDAGYWQQLESYIKNHSEADFSHCICPDCMKEKYPDLCEEEKD